MSDLLLTGAETARERQQALAGLKSLVAASTKSTTMTAAQRALHPAALRTTLAGTRHDYAAFKQAPFCDLKPAFRGVPLALARRLTLAEWFAKRLTEQVLLTPEVDGAQLLSGVRHHLEWQAKFPHFVPEWAMLRQGPECLQQSVEEDIRDFSHVLDCLTHQERTPLEVNLDPLAPELTGHHVDAGVSLRLAGRATHVAVAPGGRRLAVCTQGGPVYILRAAADGASAPPSVEARLGVCAFSSSFSGDGTRLVTTCLHGTLSVYADRPGWRRLAGLWRPTATQLYASAFSPDSARLVVSGSEPTALVVPSPGSHGQEAPSRTRALSEGQGTTCLGGHGDQILCVAWSPDGRLLASGSADRTVRLWSPDGAGGRGEAASVLDHSAPVAGVAFSPDSARLATASINGTGRVYDVATGALDGTFGTGDGAFNSVAWSPRGDRLVVANANAQVSVWSFGEGEMRHCRTYVGHRGGVGSAAFSSDGKVVYSASCDKTLHIWPVAPGSATAPSSAASRS